jgi:hypothetical protein
LLYFLHLIGSFNAKGPQCFPEPALQASYAEATSNLEQARQLTAGCVSVLESLAVRKAYPDTSWLVLRTVIRVLLWLLPEHLPIDELQAAGADGAAVQLESTSGTGGKDTKRAQKRGAHAQTQWQGSIGSSYVKAVATVSIMQMMLDAH